MERIVTTPYHPQTNGRFKRLNGSLLKLLSKMVKDDPRREWDQHLPAVLLAISARINQGTGLCPVTLTFREPAPLQEQENGSFWLSIMPKPPLEPTSSLACWNQQAIEA